LALVENSQMSVAPNIVTAAAVKLYVLLHCHCW